jgi:DNA-binding MarR family transcriptional regulator
VVWTLDLTRRRAMFRSLLGAVTDFDARLRAGFSDEELAALRDLLSRLAANAVAPSEPPRKETP